MSHPRLVRSPESEPACGRSTALELWLQEELHEHVTMDTDVRTEGIDRVQHL